MNRFAPILICAVLSALALPNLSAAPEEPAVPEIALPARLPQGHPRIFATEADKPNLKEKIRNTAWAGDLYARLERDVKPYVERHKTDPDWIVGRLQMNWAEGKHYTTFLAKNNSISERSGNAVYPTVRIAAGRVGTIGTPPLDQVEPFNLDGDIKIEKDGKLVTVPFMETGLASENINKNVLDLALSASIVYYFTGDEAYAKFAADILWVFVRGAAQQEQLNPDEKGVPAFGYLSYETLGDSRRYTSLPITYDFIYNYLDSKYFEMDEFQAGRPGSRWAPGHKQGKKWAFEQFETMFRKMVENKLTRGGGLLGNWNLNEHYSAIPYAFAMADDETRPDGRGRRYYVDQLLNRTTEGNGAYLDVIRANIQPDTGLWPEPPSGYGQGAAQQLVLYGWLYHRQGIEVLEQSPLLKKAATAFPQTAFPNGRTTCWGDGGYAVMYTLQAELMIAYAREKGDEETERLFTALLASAGGRSFREDFWMPLFFFVPELKSAEGAPVSPRVSLSPAHALLIGRSNAAKPEDALAYSVYGFTEKSGHYHEHGLAMELYGRGHILGCDFGAGPNYWDLQHRMFNRMAVAHNTVVVNGAEIGSKSYLPLTIEHAEPMPMPGDSPKSELSPNYQFSDISTTLNLRSLKARLRRVNGIVRTSPSGGFYVDIFRVKMLEGEGKTFDYLYHNLGTGFTFDFEGAAKIEPFNPDSGFGYSYLTKVRGEAGTGSISGVFDVGKAGIRMNVFVPSNGMKREFYAAESPANFRYFDSFFKKLPVPAFLMRRTDGETWTRPFVVVYEPVDGLGNAPHIDSVRELSSEPGFVAIEVKLSDGALYYVLNDETGESRHEAGDILFEGIYGVCAPHELYLGDGALLRFDGRELKQPGVMGR